MCVCVCVPLCVCVYRRRNGQSIWGFGLSDSCLLWPRRKERALVLQPLLRWIKYDEHAYRVLLLLWRNTDNISKAMEESKGLSVYDCVCVRDRETKIWQIRAFLLQRKIFYIWFESVEFMPLKLKGTLSSVEKSSHRKLLSELCGFSVVTADFFTAASASDKIPNTSIISEWRQKFQRQKSQNLCR